LSLCTSRSCTCRYEKSLVSDDFWNPSSWSAMLILHVSETGLIPGEMRPGKPRPRPLPPYLPIVYGRLSTCNDETDIAQYEGAVRRSSLAVDCLFWLLTTLFWDPRSTCCYRPGLCMACANGVTACPVLSYQVSCRLDISQVLHLSSACTRQQVS
jgi:hypothetical protein